MEQIFPLVLIPPLQVCVHCFSIIKYSLNPSIAVPLVLCDSRALYRLDLNSNVVVVATFDSGKDQRHEMLMVKKLASSEEIENIED